MTRLRTLLASVRARAGGTAIPASLGLVVAGFAAVFFGWLEASGTADVRIQMQDLISGGITGVALIMVGATVGYVTVADRSARRAEQLLARLVDRLDPTAPLALAEGDRLIATHASVHREGCDLVADAAGARPVSRREARRRGLSACRVCQPEVPGMKQVPA